MRKLISIPIEGIEKDLLKVIWAVVEATPRTGKVIPVFWLIYPVKSAEVLTIFDVILIGVGDEVERKLIHLTVYVRLLFNKFADGQSSKLENPPLTSIAAQSWLNYGDPVVVYL